jgi:hypothetical protein
MNSLSDSINNVMIERQSGASWDAFRYFIITPDGHMERELRQAERYLAGATVVSVAVAAIAANVPLLAFADFVQMAAVLVAADIVIYALMKFRLLKALRD